MCILRLSLVRCMIYDPVNRFNCQVGNTAIQLVMSVSKAALVQSCVLLCTIVPESMWHVALVHANLSIARSG